MPELRLAEVVPVHGPEAGRSIIGIAQVTDLRVTLYAAAVVGGRILALSSHHTRSWDRVEVELRYLTPPEVERIASGQGVE